MCFSNYLSLIIFVMFHLIGDGTCYYYYYDYYYTYYTIYYFHHTLIY